MSRSVWKHPFVDHCVWKSLNKQKTQLDAHNAFKKNRDENQIKNKKPTVEYTPYPKKTRVMSRRSTILKEFLGLTVSIYNGRRFYPLDIDEKMIGRKFGEFSYTRMKYIYKAKKQK